MAATSITPTEALINSIATELSCGIDAAVECWMAQVEQALTDPRLTTLGRMNAVREVLNRYKRLTGKAELRGREARSATRLSTG